MKLTAIASQFRNGGIKTIVQFIYKKGPKLSGSNKELDLSSVYPEAGVRERRRKKISRGHPIHQWAKFLNR